MVVNSGCGYVPFKAAADKVGPEQLEAMVTASIFHYRPEFALCLDLVPPPSTGVITPTSVAALRAMEKLLTEFPDAAGNRP